MKQYETVGYGPASNWKADPDPDLYQSEKQDPDQKGLDPHYWLNEVWLDTSRSGDGLPAIH